ncbi:MAG: low specificity L-threonine aldolase [Proteobacteria bacterium]|nr:low specificity L-threonine aldolase [Pseudomonadota bacterium]MBI3495903.1 low specificity L-threonine aldolase [Pseudomonadota bacterium]
MTTPVNLYSDNVSGIAPEIMAALVEANKGQAQPYGADALTTRAKAALAELFEHEVWVFPVSTGTAANALATSVLTPPYGAVYASTTAHIDVAECGATEFFTGGAKIVLVPSERGRMQPDGLTEALAKAGKGLAHRVQPAGLSLTQATERGTVYSLDEIGRLTEIAKRHGLKIHMDGARFANAVARLKVKPAEATWRLGVDVLSFGLTKNGALGVDAVICFRQDMAEEMRYRQRRAGQVYSKMRYASAQLLAYVNNGLWLKNAAHANAMGARLGNGLAAVPGVGLEEPVEINQVFLSMPEAVIAGMEAAGIGLGRRGGSQVRMVAAWSSSEAEIDGAIAAARAAAGKDKAAA